MRVILTTTLLLSMAMGAYAGTIGGVTYQDLDRNGVMDAGEPALRGVRLQLMGAEGGVVQQIRSGTDGSFEFTGLADGQYVLSASVRSNYRASSPEVGADPDPIPNFPFGRSRYSAPPSLVNNLRRATSNGTTFRHVGLGDSIGFGFNFCGSIFGEDGYFEPTTARLAGATAAGVAGNKQAVLGYETSDLLDTGSDDDIFWAVDQNAQLVSISIGGNDFLGAEDGGDAAVAAALVTGRRNLQEILSSLLTELPNADIEVNTVYDNLEGGDAFHNVWVPIWDQMLREAAWGQARRVNVAEIYPEYAHDEGGVILGEKDLICNDILGLDGIHPTNSGYDVHEEKLWQSFGGVTLAGGSDRTDISLGFVRRRLEEVADAFDDVGGTTVNPEQGLAIDDVGALVPSSGGEYRLVDFQPASVPNFDLQQAILHVRYRTTGAPIDDTYLVEASVDGSFSAPGSTPSTWNTILPVVGSSGNSGAEPLAYPDQPDFRTVAAPLYVGSPTSSDGTLDWPDLETLEVRIVAVPNGAADGFSVEVDAAWVEIFVVRPPQPSAPSERWRAEPIRFPSEVRQRLAAEIEAGAVEPSTVAAFAEICGGGDLSLIAGLLSSSSPAVRGQAARALACVEPAERSARLMALLADTDAGVRRTAARSLAGMETAPAATAELLLRDSDALVRRVGVVLAGRAGDEERLAVTARRDASLGVRIAAAASLYEAGDDRAIDLLLDSAADWPASRRALTALESRPLEATRLLIELHHADAGRRAIAARLAARSGRLQAEARAALREILVRDAVGARVLASQALARHADPVALPAIVAQALAAPSDVGFVDALAQYESPVAWAALARIAATSDQPGSIRRSAARALAATGREAVTPLLESLLAADDRRVRRLAESGLLATAAH